MTTKKTTSKPVATKATTVAKKATKRATAPAKAAVAPPREPTTAELLHPVFTKILAEFAGGLSLAAACAAIEPRLNALNARQVIFANPDLKAMWHAVREHRSHYMFEAAGDMAESTAKTDPGKAADIYLKLAERLNPREYGAKAQLALTGADGGAIKADVSMTPSEAYQQMLRRG